MTSIDVSPKYLDWGKRNFSLNGLDLKCHRFIAEDALTFLRREIKRGSRYDLVIVDPPTFGRSRTGKAFSLRKDYGKLLEFVVAVLKGNGEFFFSCNYSGWTNRCLQKKAKDVSTRLQFMAVPELPADFVYEVSPISFFLADIKQ